MADENFTENELHYSAPNKTGNEVNVAIYARTACADEQKIASQISICEDFIESIGWIPENAVIYADDGYSGLDENRPAYQQMIKDAEEGKFQILVIHDFNRLMRGSAACMDALDSLSKKHIEIFIAGFGIPAKELYSFPLAA